MWAAALGALLHMTSVAGAPSHELLEGLPPRVLSTLLDCCLRFQW